MDLTSSSLSPSSRKKRSAAAASSLSSSSSQGLEKEEEEEYSYYYQQQQKKKKQRRLGNFSILSEISNRFFFTTTNNNKNKQQQHKNKKEAVVRRTMEIADPTTTIENNNNNNNKETTTNNKKSMSKEKKEEKRQKSVKIRKHLIKEAMEEIRPLTIGTLAMIGSAIANQAVPKLLGKVLDTTTTTATAAAACAVDGTCTTAASSSSVASSLAIVVIGGGIASFLRTTALNSARDDISARLRSEAFRSLIVDRDFQWFQLSSSSSASTQPKQQQQQQQQQESERMAAPSIDPLQEEEEEEEKKASESVTAPAAATAAVLPQQETQNQQLHMSSPNDNTNTSNTNTSNTVSLSPGAIGSILSEDIPAVSDILTTSLANILRSSCSVVFATSHMIRINASLLGLSASVVPLIGAAAVILNKFVKATSEHQRLLSSEAASFAEERLSHIATVRISQREEDEALIYQQMQHQVIQLGRKLSLAKGSFMGFMFASGAGALFLVFDAGGRAVAQGQMTSGDLTSFATYTFMLGLGTSGIMRAMGELAQGMVSAERVYDLIHPSPQQQQQQQQYQQKQTNDKRLLFIFTNQQVLSIHLQMVSFTYPSSTTTTTTTTIQNKNNKNSTLKNLSFSLEPGMVIALVGKNGSGKSTLASLLAALYRPTSGKVLITLQSNNNNHNETETTTTTTKKSSMIDYFSLSRKQQSQLVQLVPQHPAFFDTTIYNNVIYSNPNATQEQIRQALTLSNCNHFLSDIGKRTHNNNTNNNTNATSTSNDDDDNDNDDYDSLIENGLQYTVGRNGCKLSGGQKQRLALCRALLSNPFLLILDEPTSALDIDGEHAVADAVQACRHCNKEQQKKALLLITHRTSSLQLADKIMVMENGRIVEEGTYEELVVKKKKNDDGSSSSKLGTLMPDLL